MQSKILRVCLNLATLRPKDVWMPSFPRAGSSWLRFILCNLISLTDLDDREELNGKVNYLTIEEILPALGRNPLPRHWVSKTIPRFIKTHQPYRPLLFQVPQKTVYIIRDPRDMMVSYYHYMQSRRDSTFQGGFSDFIRHPLYGLPAFVHHYFSWKPKITYLVHYETLKIDAHAELERMFLALELPKPDGELLETAIIRSSFESMRYVEEKDGLTNTQEFLPQTKVVRKGKVSGWKEYFSAEDIDFYRRVCDESGFFLYK